MRNNLNWLAAGLLSVVLSMTVLMPVALASSSNADDGIAPLATECPVCGEPARTTITWQDGIVGKFDEFCIHKPHGTDTWGYRIGQSVDSCTNCGWYDVSQLKLKVLVRCYGSF